MYDRHGQCSTLPPHAWMHRKGTDALLSAIENADGDTFERHVIPDTLSEAERIDREMEQRGGLLRAVEPPLVQGGQGRTGEEVSLTSILTVALIAIGVIAIALGVDQILAIVGGA